VREYSTRTGTSAELSLDEPVALEGAERVRDHLLGSARQVVVEPAVAMNASSQEIEQVDLPLAGEDLPCGASPRDHL
jgi:hypothetical protein